MTQQQIIDALKIAEEIPDLEAELRYIEDIIDDDGPKIFELKRQKDSLLREVQALQENIEFARELTDSKLKSMQEEIASAREQTNIELNIQKQLLDNEVDEYNSSLQEKIDKLKQEEQGLTRSIQQLNNEELEILRLVEV